MGDWKFGSEQLEHDSALLIVNEGKNIGATFTKPKMQHDVMTKWRLGRWICLARRFPICTESKELAASEPVKSSRASRIGTLGVKVLIQGLSFHRFAVRHRLLLLVLMKEFPLVLEAPDRGPQPISNYCFSLILIVVPIQRIERLTGRVEWNVPTGDLLRAVLGR